MSVPDRRALVDGGSAPSIRKQCQLLGVARSGVYRKPRPGKTGHVAISKGDGTTIEAMDTAHGVAVGKIAGRKWDVCFKVPGLEYAG